MQIKIGRKNVYFEIDDEDLPKIKGHSFGLNKKGYVTATWWDRKNKKYFYFTVHRLIMGNETPMMIDHINHNKLDNRKLNLRFCTNKQNQWNAGKHKDSKSKYKGVVFYKDTATHRRTKKWAARINNKLIGFFETEDEAALAYNTRVKKLYGDFAFLNECKQ